MWFKMLTFQEARSYNDVLWPWKWNSNNLKPSFSLKNRVKRSVLSKSSFNFFHFLLNKIKCWVLCNSIFLWGDSNPVKVICNLGAGWELTATPWKTYANELQGKKCEKYTKARWNYQLSNKFFCFIEKSENII